ncbi:MAG: helicase-related protein [Gemmatimonadales bacterium]
MRWPRWLRTAPPLVAESLVEVVDPLAAWLRIGEPRPARTVMAALARALLPGEARDHPPEWLRPDQALSFRRAVAAARRFGGALLADSVGTGKTYIGIAAAAALGPGRPLTVLVPASLREQWQEAAKRTGVPLLLHSHETLSRGRLPAAARGPVIVDESHRFRNPDTRRYRCLAPWLTGRRGILLSATPAVNGADDVAHQLLLLVRDDALAGHGVPSLRSDLRRGGASALAHLVVTGEDRTRERPARHAVLIRAPEDPDELRLLDGLDDLALSRDPGIAALVRLSLITALASSPAALVEALRGYRDLLRHASEATAAGRRLDRAALRRTLGGMTGQLVMWELLPDPAASGELVPGDLERVVALARDAAEWAARGDQRVAYLARVLEGDDRPTLVFATARATIPYLRDRLRGSAPAWCTGAAAGIGSHRMDRAAVLGWFRNGRPAARLPPGPRVLLATDVAAEGLDLSRIERVVHYDLPWTDVRLAQREGRALRLGASHQWVEVLRFAPHESIEERMRRAARIAAKSSLPLSLGLGEDRSAPWRTSARLAQDWGDTDAAEGIACIACGMEAAIVGYRIAGSAGECWPTVRVRVNGEWRSDAALLAHCFEAAKGGVEAPPPEAGAVRKLLTELAPVMRDELRAAHRLSVLCGEAASAPRLRRRLLELARHAARHRDADTVALTDRALRLLSRGRTAGEDALLSRLGALPDRGLVQAVKTLAPDEPGRGAVSIRLVGVLVLVKSQVTVDG